MILDDAADGHAEVQLGAAADSKSRTPFAPGGMFLAYVFASGSLTSLACVHNQTCSGPSATRGSRGGAGCRAAAPLRREPGPRITGACPRDVPEPPPTANDRHQQQPANMKPARPSSPRPTPENTLVMRSSLVGDEAQAAEPPTIMHDRRRRARCVPDRPVNDGKSRSLADSPMRRLTSEEAG